MTLSPISERVKDIEKYNLELHIHAKDNGKYIKKIYTSKPPETSHKRYSTYPQGWHGQITKDQVLHFYRVFWKVWKYVEYLCESSLTKLSGIDSHENDVLILKIS